MTGVNQDLATRICKLKRALHEGHIDQDTYDAAVAGLNAQLDGSGANAKGSDALALGAEATFIKGDNNGTVNYGVIIEQGPPSEVIDNPQHERTRAFLSRVN